MFENLKKSRRSAKGSSSTRGGKKRESSRLISFVGWLFGTLSGIVKLAIATSIVTAIVAAISYYTVSEYVKGETVAVPLVVGEDVSKALTLLAAQDLTLELERREFSDTKPEGVVLDQNPAPDTQVKAGAPVLVKVSAGQKMTAVPDLRRRNVPDAKIKIQDAGLRNGIQTEIESSVVSPGMVITSDPPPNAQAPRDSQVNLLISSGPPKIEIGMPRLTGRTIDKASELLALLGLSIDEAYEEPRSNATPGLIADQSPLPGVRVGPEDSIRVVVALEPARKTANSPESATADNVLKVVDYN